ncbi:hypothetical protein ACF0H5_019080 [Mactra antiquata]
MSREHKDTLRRHRVDIVEDLEPKGAVLDSLYEDGVLTENDIELVTSARTRKERVQSLLSIIPTRGPVAYGSFQKALEVGEYDNLAKLLVPARLNNRHHVQPDKPLISGSCLPCVKFSERFENKRKIENVTLTNLLRWQCCLFLDNIEPRDVIDQFFQDHVIDMYDIELIMSHATRRQRCEILFDILLQNPDTAVVVSLKRALMKKYRYIVEEIVSSGVEKSTMERSKHEAEQEANRSIANDGRRPVGDKYVEGKSDDKHYRACDCNQAVRPLRLENINLDMQTCHRHLGHNTGSGLRKKRKCKSRISNTEDLSVTDDMNAMSLNLDDSDEYTKLSFGSFDRSKINNVNESTACDRNGMTSSMNDSGDYTKLTFGSLVTSKINRQQDCNNEKGQQKPIEEDDVCTLGDAEELDLNSLLTNDGVVAEHNNPTLAVRQGSIKERTASELAENTSSVTDDINLNNKTFHKLKHNTDSETVDKPLNKLHTEVTNIGDNNTQLQDIIFAQRDTINASVKTNTDSDFITMSISETGSTRLHIVDLETDRVTKDAERLFITGNELEINSNEIKLDSAPVEANRREEILETEIDCVDGFIVEQLQNIVASDQIIQANKCDNFEPDVAVKDVFQIARKKSKEETSPSKKIQDCQQAIRDHGRPQHDSKPLKEMLPISVTSTRTERPRKRLAVAFNYLSTLINQGEFVKFQDVSSKLQKQFPCNYDLMCIIGYLQTSRDLFQTNFDSAKKNINATLALVPKTSNPRYFTLEIFTAKTRMYITRKKLEKLQTALDEAMMILETDPVGCTGRATGWLCINHARNKTAQLTCLNLSKPSALATYENLFQRAKSCFQRSMTNFKMDGGKDGPFGFGYALCRLVILLLRCGDNGLTMDILTPPEDDVQSAGQYLQHLEDSEIAISKILEMHFRLAKCDYQFRRHKCIRALEHAHIAFDIASDMNLLEFKKHAHNRVSNLQLKTSKILQADVMSEKETEDILFGPTSDHDDSDDSS